MNAQEIKWEIDIALEKAREARKYYDALPLLFRKPFMAILKNTRDLQQTKDAVEFLMESEVELGKVS